MRKTSTPVRVMAVMAGGSVLAAMHAFPATASAEGDVKVVNTETVKIYTDANGEVQSKRIYEQLALTGNGTVDITNPVVADGLRNLDGFGGFDVEDGEQVVNVDVEGEENLRSVSDYDGDMPLDISASYVLDGEELDPEDVVGRSGELTVTYTVKNITQESTLVSFPDGKGGTMSREVEVMMPMVGSLTTTLPNNFRNPQSQANMAGDGEGGTKLSFTMTLLAPIGSDTAELTYTADVVDAVVPDASISALPVNPLEVPSFKSAGESYQGGAATGGELANGAATIDSNLLKLRDGASRLLAGMIQLRDGAGDLNKGLADTAVPGAMKLAAGAEELHTGMGRLYAGTLVLSAGSTRLSDGSIRLADGTTRLADGATRVADGSRTLADKTGLLSDGASKIDEGVEAVDGYLTTLASGQEGLLAGLRDLRAGVQGLPAEVKSQLAGNPEYQRLLGTLTKLVAGIGTPTDTSSSTLLGGLNQIRTGVGNAAGAASTIAGKLSSGATTIDTKLLPAALGLYDTLAGMGTCSPRTGALPPTANLGLGGANPCYLATVVAYGYGAPKGSPGSFADGGFAVQAQEAAGFLTQIASGLNGAAIPGIDGLKKALFNANCNPAQTNPAAADFCGMAQAIGFIKSGVPVLVDQILVNIQATLLTGIGDGAEGCDPTKTLLCGAAELAAGGSELSGGFEELVVGADDLAAGAGLLADGAGELSVGAGQVADGAGELRDGAGELSAGAGKLSDGTGELADGARQLNDGSVLLADGAGKLSDGLGDAADGSGLLFDGLTAAALGVPKLRDGAQKLSDKGTSKLVDAGLSTAQEFGLMYGVLEAGAQRADDGKMMVGAPEDAIGLAAYSYEIKGEDGEGGRNMTRGLAGLALLGAGAAAFAVRRRFI